jgi:hypothetical protein
MHVLIVKYKYSIYRIRPNIRCPLLFEWEKSEKENFDKTEYVI